MSQKTYLTITTREELRDIFYIQGDQPIMVVGSSPFSIDPLEIWLFDMASLLSDNGTTVLKRSDMLDADPGRYRLWFKQKKVETFSGSTNSSGNYTVTFTNPYPSIPNVQPQPINPDVRDVCRVTSVSTTGFTINIQRRTDLAGLVPTYAAVNAASISVLVTSTN